MLDKKVKISLHTEVKSLLIQDGVCCGVELSDGRKIKADAVVVATGGMSYASTGSTGDGYRFAQQTGHKLVETKPALVPFTVKESWPLSLQGLALKNVELTLQDGKKQVYNGFGTERSLRSLHQRTPGVNNLIYQASTE